MDGRQSGGAQRSTRGWLLCGWMTGGIRWMDGWTCAGAWLGAALGTWLASWAVGRPRPRPRACSLEAPARGLPGPILVLLSPTRPGAPFKWDGYKPLHHQQNPEFRARSCTRAN